MAQIEWKDDAACHNLDTDIFFDKYEEDVDLRRAVDELCQGCPVKRQCLTHGVSRQEYGVWGGVYLDKGKISREFNNHKKKAEWFDTWMALTMEKE